MKRELRIDPDIQAALRPMTAEEWGQFSKNVLSDGKILEPLIVWKGKDIIVDGHHRWRAIKEFGLTNYTIEEKDFEDVDDAILWLLKHQKGRRNISDNQLNVLIGKAYNRQKAKVGGNNPEGVNQYTVERLNRQPDESTNPVTVEVVGEAYGVSPKTVERAAQFVEVLGEIEEKSSPEVVQRLVTTPEKIPTSHLVVIKEQIDENPDVVTEYLELTPYQRSKRAAFFRGSACLSRDCTQVDVAKRFNVSESDIQFDVVFATLVTKVAKINPDIADWIMNSPRFPIKSANKLLDSQKNPIMGAVKCVKECIETGKSFAAGLEKWESFQKAKKVGKELGAVVAESDRKTRDMFKGATSICFPPTIRELFCEDCHWGFDTYLPEPGKVSCPYCKGDNIVKRAEDWTPRRR